MSDNRPAVYLEGDTVIYRASALGGHLCTLWAARNNMERKPFPHAVQQGMDEGTALEPTILQLLYDKHEFSFAYGKQFKVELNLGAWNGKTLIVRGALDEVGGRDGQVYPIDVKAFTQDQIDKPLPDRYNWQQSVYAHGFGSGHYIMPIFNKATWEIEPRSLSPRVPMYTREQIRERVLQVEEAYYAGKMPDCPSDYACPYYYLHEQFIPDALPDNVVPIVHARIKLTEKIKTLEVARRKLDEVISGKLDQDVTYLLDNYTIVMFANPARFDTKAAQRLLTDAEVDWENDPEFWIPGKGTQLRMTPKKAKNARTSDDPGILP